MKTFSNVWSIVTSTETLARSVRLAAKGKRDRPGVQQFLQREAAEVDCLQQDLLTGSYQPKPYIQFKILDPKPRVISCADFRDRVVHHALCDTCAPFIERRFVEHSYACRKGKGGHRAVEYAQKLCRRYRYFLKTDIRAFYDSVDIRTAVDQVTRHFKEESLKNLWCVVLQHPFPGQLKGKGLPIGNLTSQWTANAYLDEMDHLIKEVWRIPGYARYMDDMVFWSDDKDTLWWVKENLSQWLSESRMLELKTSGTFVAPCSEGLPFLGMRIFPGALRFQHKRYWRSKRLVRRRIEELQSGLIGREDFEASIQAVCGLTGYWGLKNVIRV